MSSNEGFEDHTDTPHPLATPKEKYLWGFLKGTEFSRNNVTIRPVKGRGRSAFAAKSFNAGDFVCEYRGVVRKKEKGKPDYGDQRNASLGLGSYCLDATFENVEYTFDATASINDPGRYINHASKNYNLLKMPPAMIGGPPSYTVKPGKPANSTVKPGDPTNSTVKPTLKIGFIAKRDISKGDELFFHYGLKYDPELPWISTNAKDISTTLEEQDRLHQSRAR